VLRRATLEAARSLGLGSRVGSLEVGKEADLVAVSLASARTCPAPDPHAALVLDATPDDVTLTMVAGQVLFDGREVTTLDEPRLVDRCRRRAGLLRTPSAGPDAA
jgi:5-methylthioadenosine/S-adenosylhomocysteine deaminase